jgi:flagellar basal-body rod modification protein FlgD
MDPIAAPSLVTVPPPGAPTAAAAGALDYDAFLQLLIAEMENQDPTDPMETSEYVAQFAAFSSVEQSIQTNAKLDAMLTSFALAQADSVLGHTVASADGSVSGEVVSLTVTSEGALATLADGRQLMLGAGVTIGGAAVP